MDAIYNSSSTTPLIRHHRNALLSAAAMSVEKTKGAFLLMSLFLQVGRNWSHWTGFHVCLEAPRPEAINASCSLRGKTVSLLIITKN